LATKDSKDTKKLAPPFGDFVAEIVTQEKQVKMNSGNSIVPFESKAKTIPGQADNFIMS
jgi:hypothetical protein